MTASSEFNVVAILYPKKGKTEQVLALLKDVAEHIKKEEPGTLRFEVNRVLKPARDGTEDIVLLERYGSSWLLRQMAILDLMPG